jgi:hypothetical protein
VVSRAVRTIRLGLIAAWAAARSEICEGQGLEEGRTAGFLGYRTGSLGAKESSSATCSGLDNTEGRASGGQRWAAEAHGCGKDSAAGLWVTRRGGRALEGDGLGQTGTEGGQSTEVRLWAGQGSSRAAWREGHTM